MRTYSPPPFLIPASLIFWGWQTRMWGAAVFLALLASSHLIFTVKWEFSSKDYSHISDLCVLLFFGSISYLYIEMGTIYVVFKLIQWLPALMSPLLIIQHYSISGKIDLRAVSFFFRGRKLKNESASRRYQINMDYPYALLCVLSAGFGNQRHMGFYIGLLVLSAFSLWRIRSKERSLVLWTMLFTGAAFFGFWGHTRLHALHRYLEAKGLEWFYDVSLESDPYQSITGLGYIGDLKPSSRILFRARFPSAGTPLPLLLREAAYNRYKTSKWFAVGAAFEHAVKQGDIWQAASGSGGETGRGPTELVTVSTPVKNGIGLLKLPTGTRRITGLAGTNLEKNRFGVIKIRSLSGILDYTAEFGKTTPADAPPLENDLTIPQEEMAAVKSVAEALRLKQLPSGQAIKKLSDYFEKNYTYSLTLDPRFAPTPLADFLQRTRSGHCEYFATATVLILRASGIPARYAVGYSVHEWSPWEDAYVIRRRHAHAWAVVFVDNVWQDVDNTPSRWRAEEKKQASSWEFMTDVWSWIEHRFLKWRFQNKSRHLPIYLIACISLLCLIIFRRLMKKYRKKKPAVTAAPVIFRPEPPGVDSPFYVIEQRLAKTTKARQPGDTLSRWIERLEDTLTLSPDCIADLRELAACHYRFRFDPEGLSPGEEKAFRAKAEKWQEAYGEDLTFFYESPKL